MKRKGQMCLALFATSAIFFWGCGNHSPSASSHRPTWKTNSVLAGRLGAEAALPNYGIRPPLGYTESYGDSLKLLQPFGVTMHLWHNDNSNPNASWLSIHVITRTNLATPDAVLNYDLKPRHKQDETFWRSKTEDGTVNGIPFARAYWQRIKTKSSGIYVERGVSYASANFLQGIYIEGNDEVPCGSEPCQYRPSDFTVLPVLEAAILTFRKR